MSIRIGEHGSAVGLRLPYELRRAAEQAARERGWSLSDFCRWAISQGVQQPPPPPRIPARRPRPGGQVEPR